MAIPNPGDRHRVVVQSTPTTDSTLFHGMGKEPAVVVVNSANTTIRALVSYPDINHVRVQSNLPITFRLILN